MKAILMTSSALVLAVGLSGAQAQDDACPASIDAFTRDYEEAMEAGGDQALSMSEQADLFGLRTAAESAHRAGNPELCIETIDRARLMLETALAPTVLRPDDLVGMDVRNAADESLGTIDDVTLDPMTGRIAYVLVEHGGFLGIGDSLYPVPWRAVTWVPGSDALLLDITEEQLENGPRDIEEETTAQQRRAWLLSMHSYYGVEPYWQAGVFDSGEPPAADQEGVPLPEGDTETGAGTEAETAPGTTDEAAVTQPGEGDEAAVAGANGAASTADEASAVPQGQDRAESGGAEGLDALRTRVDELEEKVREFSEQSVGEEVRQAIATLESRVQELADSAPGQQVQESMADLEQRVQELTESAPGQEIRSAVADLQTRVQELAESEPAQDLREQMARLEAQVREFVSGSESPSAGESGSAFQDESAGSNAAPTTRTIVIKPEDVRVIEPGGSAAGAQDAAQGATAQGDADVAAPEGQEGIADGAQADAEAEDSGGSAEDAGDEAAATSTGSPNTQAGAEAGGEAAAAAPQSGEVESCEAAIARLEKDLARAEEAGLSVATAQETMASARAMLNRGSEALCRAAIKRAADDLAAQGLEPAQGG